MVEGRVRGGCGRRRSERRMEAVIKSNTERIRSDVTQAVRADSTPGGMQKPSAEKLSVPQKKFPAPTPYPPYPPPSPVNVPTSRALLSRQTYYTI